MSGRSLVLGLAILAAGCSKPDALDRAGHSESVIAEATKSSVLGPSPSASTSAGPEVLTPEDIEPETERRITEHNLESELDRLEREIQGQ